MKDYRLNQFKEGPDKNIQDYWEKLENENLRIKILPKLESLSQEELEDLYELLDN